jgi:hypothetical protein
MGLRKKLGAARRFFLGKDWKNGVLCDAAAPSLPNRFSVFTFSL